MFDPLSTFAEIYYGKSPSSIISGEGFVPVFGTGGIYAKGLRSLFNGPAVIIPRKGTLSNPHYAPGPFWASDTTYAALPRPKVSANWLHYQLSQFRLESLNEATGVPSISRDWLAKIKIHRHSPVEQQTVANVIASVDAQIEATEALIAKQERVRAGLLQDLFTRGVDEHGALRPPREEAPHLYHETELGWFPKGWRPLSIACCSQSLIDGPFGSNLKSEHYVEEAGVRVVRLQNIQSGFYDASDAAFISDRYAAILSKHSVLANDVLIASLGDDTFVAGRACLYPHRLGVAINKADCFRLRAN